MAGPDAAAAADRLAAAVPAPVAAVLDRLRDHGHAGLRRRRHPCATPSSAASRPTGTSPPTPAPTGSSSCFPGAVYENRFGTVAVPPRRRAVRDHDLPPRARLRRLPAAAPGRVRRRPRGRPRPPRLHGQRDGLGRRADGDGAAARRRPVRRARATWSGGSCAPSATRPPVPRGRAADGPGGPPRGRPRAHDRARDAGRDRGQRPARRAPLRRAGRARARRLLDAPRPSVGLRLAADTGLLAAIAPELAAQRGIPQNKIPGEDLWDHAAPHGRRGAGRPRPIVRLAALVHDVGKPVDAGRRPLPPTTTWWAPARRRRSSRRLGSRARRSTT